MLERTLIQQENEMSRYIKKDGALSLNERYRDKTYHKTPFKQNCPFCSSEQIMFDNTFGKFVCNVCGEAWRHVKQRY